MKRGLQVRRKVKVKWIKKWIGKWNVWKVVEKLATWSNCSPFDTLRTLQIITQINGLLELGDVNIAITLFELLTKLSSRLGSADIIWRYYLKMLSRDINSAWISRNYLTLEFISRYHFNLEIISRYCLNLEIISRYYTTWKLSQDIFSPWKLSQDIISPWKLSQDIISNWKLSRDIISP